MKLRDHPLIHSASEFNWPPVWTGVVDFREILHGEVGILKNALFDGPVEPKLYLIIEHDRKLFCGSLFFNDAVFARTIFALLQENIGRMITQVGDIDLSFML